MKIHIGFFETFKKTDIFSLSMLLSRCVEELSWSTEVMQLGALQDIQRSFSVDGNDVEVTIDPVSFQSCQNFGVISEYIRETDQLVLLLDVTNIASLELIKTSIAQVMMLFEHQVLSFPPIYIIGIGDPENRFSSFEDIEAELDNYCVEQFELSANETNAVFVYEECLGIEFTNFDTVLIEMTRSHLLHKAFQSVVPVTRLSGRQIDLQNAKLDAESFDHVLKALNRFKYFNALDLSGNKKINKPQIEALTEFLESNPQLRTIKLSKGFKPSRRKSWGKLHSKLDELSALQTVLESDAAATTSTADPAQGDVVALSSNGNALYGLSGISGAGEAGEAADSLNKDQLNFTP